MTAREDIDNRIRLTSDLAVGVIRQSLKLL